MVRTSIAVVLFNRLNLSKEKRQITSVAEPGSSEAKVEEYSAEALWERVNGVVHRMFGNVNGDRNPRDLLTIDASSPSEDWSNVTDPTERDIEQLAQFSTFWKEMDRQGWEQYEGMVGSWQKKLLNNISAWKERRSGGTGAASKSSGAAAAGSSTSSGSGSGSGSGGGSGSGSASASASASAAGNTGSTGDGDDSDEAEGEEVIEVDEEEEEAANAADLDLKNEPPVEENYNSIRALLQSGDNPLIVKNLWSLVATLAAGQVGRCPVTGKVKTLKLAEIYLQMESGFQEVLKSVPQIELFCEELFAHMPHNNNVNAASAEDGNAPTLSWPPSFLQAVQIKQEAMPKGNVLKGLKKMCGGSSRPTDQDAAAWDDKVLATVKKTYFGKYLWDLQNDNRKEVVNRLNPMWMDPLKLPSGASFEQMLQAMSRGYYTIKAKTDGKKAVDGRIRRAKEANKEDTLTTENTSVEKEIQTRIQKYKNVSYPAFWLSFMFCGEHAQYKQLTDKRYIHVKQDLVQFPTIPCAKKAVIPANKGGAAASSTPTTTGSLIDDAKISGQKNKADSSNKSSDYTLSRGSRKRGISVGSSLDDDDDGNKNGSEKKLRHEVVIKIDGGGEVSKLNQVKQTLELLEKRLVLLQRMLNACGEDEAKRKSLQKNIEDTEAKMLETSDMLMLL